MFFIYNSIVDISTLKYIKRRIYCDIINIDENKFIVHVKRKVHRYVYQYDYDIIRHPDDVIEMDCKFNGGILLKCHVGLRDIDEPRMEMVKIDDYPERFLLCHNNADTQKHYNYAIDKINKYIMYLLLTDKHFSSWR